MPTPIEYNPSKHAHLLPSIVDIHIDCITSDATIATFLPPLSHDKMLPWWTARAKEVAAGTRHIIIELDEEEKEATGVAMLWKTGTETGPFRCSVEKLLVSPRHRQKGIAKRIMGMIEEVAGTQGITMILLDTIVGTPAELVYPKLGYTEVGVIPKYEISPWDKSLKGARFFYKTLPNHGKSDK